MRDIYQDYYIYLNIMIIIYIFKNVEGLDFIYFNFSKLLIYVPVLTIAQIGFQSILLKIIYSKVNVVKEWQIESIFSVHEDKFGCYVEDLIFIFPILLIKNNIISLLVVIVTSFVFSLLHKSNDIDKSWSNRLLYVPIAYYSSLYFGFLTIMFGHIIFNTIVDLINKAKIEIYKHKGCDDVFVHQLIYNDGGISDIQAKEWNKKQEDLKIKIKK